MRAGSPVGGKYDHSVNRESAAEKLAQRAGAQVAKSDAPPARTAEQDAAQGDDWGQAVKDAVFGTKRRQGMVETMAKSVVRNAGSQLGRALLRGVLGSLKR